MRKMLVLALLISALLPGCGLMQPREIPVAGACPKPPQAPSVLTDKPVSTGPSISERLETLILERDDSLTKARR